MDHTAYVDILSISEGPVFFQINLKYKYVFVLFDLILYVPLSNFLVMPGRVFHD